MRDESTSTSQERKKILMKSHILVPLDGSKRAETVLPHALFFARQTQSVLTLLLVIMPPGEPAYEAPYIPDDWYEDAVSWTKNYLNSIAARLQAQGVPTDAQYMEGTFAGATINSYAEVHPEVQLIALATHGRDAGGRLLLGSVAGDIYSSASTSLLILRPAKDEHIAPGAITDASYETIVVPLDGTEVSERALERATDLALACKASVLLVSVFPSHLLEEEVVVDELVDPLQKVPAPEEKERVDILEDQAEQLRTSTGLLVQTLIAQGDPGASIERYFGENQRHQLIVTTREQAEHKVMRFLHHSNVPVLFLAL
jgi:nucleotide-binding universal stress UspA family protein